MTQVKNVCREKAVLATRLNLVIEMIAHLNKIIIIIMIIIAIIAHNNTGWQKLASFRQAQKMPSILSSDAYLLIRDKKRSFT